MESFLWIGITFATFSFLGNIPVANDVLKMIERCSDISPVSSLRILVGMLFGPADFLGFKLEIILIISSFVEGEMKNESWLGGGKYSEKLLYEHDTSDWTSAAAEQKKLLKSVCNCSRISSDMAFETYYFWWIICRFLERNYGSDSFSGIFHVVDVIFKILVVVTFFTLL